MCHSMLIIYIQIFGGYASEYLRPAQRYYGSGESFLFRLAPKLDVYPWPNTNHFFIYSTERFISMGGGYVLCSSVVLCCECVALSLLV